MNAFHSTNLFCCFSGYQALTKSVAPSFSIFTTNNPQFLDSLWWRVNAQNVSFWISLRWPIHIINPLDKTNYVLACSHRCSTCSQVEKLMICLCIQRYNGWSTTMRQQKEWVYHVALFTIITFNTVKETN